MVNRRDIDHPDLRLDQSNNPRHDPAPSQRSAIAALLANRKDQDKTVNLAKHMAKNGPSPTDTLLVVEEGSHYIVIEGNRRTAALKLLHNPDLAQDLSLAKRFRQVAASADQLPTQLHAVVLDSRADAREWQILRHGGEGHGAGVVPWNAEAAQRFHRKPGSHADRALTVLDALGDAYSNDDKLVELIERVKKSKLTTFGRLVSDPDFRTYLGIDLRQGTLTRHYSIEVLKPAFNRILQDLDTHLTVSGVKDKDQRHQYAASISDDLPAASEYSAAEPFGNEETPAKKPKRKTRKPAQKLFGDLALVNAPDRLQDLITETRKLSLKAHPNATALLVRTVVELMVAEAIAKQNWRDSRYLKDRIAICLKHIDPGGKDDRYQAVRIGLASGNDMMSVKTLHAWVHNVHFNPSPADLHTIARNWTPFVQVLDDYV